MKSLLRWGAILSVLGVIGFVAVGPYGLKLFQRKPIEYREAEVTRGRVVAVVNSTGTVKPVRTVTVGTFVSGPIETIFVDHNTEVKKDSLLAKIDSRIYKAAVDRDRANLATQKANVEQAKAKWQQAKNDEARSKTLRAQNKGFISDSEMDQFKFNRLSLESQVGVMEAAVLQAQASLDTSLLNFGYCEIRSPVDGLVIDRKVDPGQTVAASFQTPDLFVVAPDMRKEMYVYASVDETDIGLVQAAQESGQPVRFTVDAYPDELFVGRIHQVRKNSTTTQNVVTYPVVVSAPNPDLKLLPGMTASISFQVGERTDVLRIPNAALRYYPPRDQVRPEDRKILERTGPSDDKEEQTATTRSAEEIAESRRMRSRRHVWVVDGHFLRAIEVITGLSDNRFTEVVSGELSEGQKLVTGLMPKE